LKVGPGLTSVVLPDKRAAQRCLRVSRSSSSVRRSRGPLGNCDSDSSVGPGGIGRLPEGAARNRRPRLGRPPAGSTAGPPAPKPRGDRCRKIAQRLAIVRVRIYRKVYCMWVAFITCGRRVEETIKARHMRGEVRSIGRHAGISTQEPEAAVLMPSFCADARPYVLGSLNHISDIVRLR